MIAGDTVVKVVYLQTLSGRGLSYANKAAFQADGWDISWVDTTITALTSQPTWTIAVESGNTRGKHNIVYTVPSGVSVAKVTVPGWATDPGAWSLEGQTYDEDSIAGTILTSQGTPGVQSATDGDLGDVVDGDSWNSGTLYIPLGKLSVFGYGFSDLASGWTISAGLKSDPSDTQLTGATATFGATVATDGAVSVGWTTFLTGMALASTERSKDWFLDVQLKKTSSSQIITTNRYKLTVVWQRNTTT